MYTVQGIQFASFREVVLWAWNTHKISLEVPEEEMCYIDENIAIQQLNKMLEEIAHEA